jgi:hypothetical protein
MSYLHHFIARFHLGSPYSSLHGPWPAALRNLSNETLPPVEQRLSVAVLRPHNGIDTICGLKLRFTVESDATVAILDSTIGGLIVVNGTIYGFTTAHGIVNHILGSRCDMS